MDEVPRSRLRIGILGAAAIARAFVSGVKPSERISVVAVASRNAERAARFALEYGLERSHASYDALLSDSTIDAVYVPLPNALHAEWSIRAARAGKHVLCEKPIAASAEQARKMFEAARTHGVHIVEAFPYRSQPQTLRLIELVRDGTLGPIQLIQANFGIMLPEGDNIRLDPLLAGGSLLDVGVYPVSLARMVLGERPKSVQAIARWTGTGVDSTLAATLAYRTGALAQICCSFVTSPFRQAVIAGSNGVAWTTYQNHGALDESMTLQLRIGSRGDAKIETLVVPSTNGFLAEAESFEQMIRLGDAHWNGVSPHESVDTMATMEAILQSARTGEVVQIND